MVMEGPGRTTVTFGSRPGAVVAGTVVGAAVGLVVVAVLPEQPAAAKRRTVANARMRTPGDAAAR
jgi:hypothetical protein